MDDERADLWEEIVRLRRAGVPAALCTVVSTRGSTPGKQTMKMLVRADGTTLGSVGGGCVEKDAVAMAREAIASDRARTRTFQLNRLDDPDTGLICGGQVTILAEPVVPPRLVLFGGGHVAEAVARMAPACDFHVEVCDPRPEFANPSRHPEAHATFCGSWAEAVARQGGAEHHYLVVVTRGHHDDLEVLRELWRARVRPPYLGMIGSRAKKAQLDRILADEGADAAWLAAVKTPIGLEIGARSPGEIAVSLLAELVRLRRLGVLEPAPERPLRAPAGE